MVVTATIRTWPGGLLPTCTQAASSRGTWGAEGGHAPVPCLQRTQGNAAEAAGSPRVPISPPHLRGMDPAAGEANARMPALLQHVATAKPGDGKKPPQPGSPQCCPAYRSSSATAVPARRAKSGLARRKRRGRGKAIKKAARSYLSLKVRCIAQSIPIPSHSKNPHVCPYIS